MDHDCSGPAQASIIRLLLCEPPTVGGVLIAANEADEIDMEETADSSRLTIESIVIMKEECDENSPTRDCRHSD
jgi:hypothetical protein